MRLIGKIYKLQDACAEVLGVSPLELYARLNVFMNERNKINGRALAEIGIPMCDGIEHTSAGDIFKFKSDEEILKWVIEVGTRQEKYGKAEDLRV